MERTTPSYAVPRTVDEAREIQRELQKKIVTRGTISRLRLVAGCDLSFVRSRRELVCGIIVFSFPRLEEKERVWVTVPERFPYVPGFLAFREGPAIMQAWTLLSRKPDVLICDGHGIAHPRGVGIASHVGVLLDVPTIGVAKKKLYGNYREPPQFEGGLSQLLHPVSGRVIGAVLRTRRRVKPVFVSVGHRIGLSSAVRIVAACARGYRLPEPTRLADKWVGELRRALQAGHVPPAG